MTTTGVGSGETVAIGARIKGLVVVVVPASFVVEVVVVMADLGLERIVTREPTKPLVNVMSAVRMAGSA